MTTTKSLGGFSAFCSILDEGLGPRRCPQHTLDCLLVTKTVGFSGKDLPEGEVERNHVLSELSRVKSVYPRPSQGTSYGRSHGSYLQY
jgi:hypothetical protein